MKRMRMSLLLAAIAAAPTAFPQCALPSNPAESSLSKEKQDLRDAIYLDLCSKAGGDMVNVQDRDLAARLVYPSKFPVMEASPSENIAKEVMSLKAPVTVVYILEPNGKVSWAAILDSSGLQRVDAAAVAITKAMYYRKPVTLDGRPVRLFNTIRIFGPRPKQCRPTRRWSGREP